jgi:hypothetical protein
MFVRVWFTRFIGKTLAVSCLRDVDVARVFEGRLIVALIALVVPVTSLNAARPCCGETPMYGSLAGQLLIASPALRDSHFDHAVILGRGLINAQP